MKTFPNSVLSLLSFMLIVIFTHTSCEKDDQFQFNDPSLFIEDSICSDLAARIKNMSQLPIDPKIEKTKIGNSTVIDDGNYICTTQPVKWGVQYDERTLLDPKVEVIYIGNDIVLESLNTGEFKPYSMPNRGQYTISISLPASPGLSSKEIIDSPSLSNVRDGINRLLERVAPNSTSADMRFSKEEIHAKEVVDLALGAGFSGWGASIKANYDFSSEKLRSKILIKFVQKYYTVDVDIPKSICEWFDQQNLPDPSLFEGLSPVYVSSVTYGRMVYFMLESSASMDEVNKALEASFSAFGKSGTFDISEEHKKVLNESSISAFIVGGSASGAAGAISGIDGMMKFIQKDATFSVNSPGVPIAYTTRFFSDNSVAKLSLSSEYTIRNCEPKGIETTVTPGNDGGSGYFRCAKNIGTADGEFGGNGPLVKGEFNLKCDDNKNVYLLAKVKWTEQISNNPTIGEVEDEIFLYTVPPGYIFVDFLGISTVRIDEFCQGDGEHIPDIKPSGSFVKSVRLIGDTDGGDLGCDGDADANITFKLNPFKIRIRKE